MSYGGFPRAVASRKSVQEDIFDSIFFFLKDYTFVVRCSVKSVEKCSVKTDIFPWGEVNFHFLTIFEHKI